MTPVGFLTGMGLAMGYQGRDAVKCFIAYLVLNYIIKVYFLSIRTNNTLWIIKS